MNRNGIRGWMRKTMSSKRQKPLASHHKAMEPAESNNNEISDLLITNINILRSEFKDCSDVVFREFKVNHQLQGVLVFIEGLVNADDIHDSMLTPLLSRYKRPEDNLSPTVLEDNYIAISQLSRENTYAKVIEAILGGNGVLMIDGHAEALILNIREGIRRGVQEPATESVVRGPREGFTENLRTNTALVRFKIKSPRLKYIPFIIGEHTKTNVVLAYIEGLADPRVLDEARNRLKEITIDGVLESGYIEELIEDNPSSPFPQLQYTERPDTVAGQLLEGKFAIFVDGTPFVMTAPITAWQMLQASEDYYERYWAANFIRWLRFIFLFISLFTPALYVAVLTFHQDLLPTTLILSVAAAREAIPFPAIVEALIMEIAFEALREASVRLPRTVGQAVSVLGALVIGQAAVEAGIVSAPMVIIVSLTGIASFTIPRFNFAISIRLLRFPLMFASAAFGLFGIIIVSMWILVHLCHLRSFGVPYLSGIAPYEEGEIKDILVRVPWWKMVFRPSSYSELSRQRMKKGMRPSPSKR